MENDSTTSVLENENGVGSPQTTNTASKTPIASRSKGTKPTTNGSKKKSPGKAVAAKPQSPNSTTRRGVQTKFPKHPLRKSLRIPSAILEQNAGRECTDVEAAGFLRLKLTGVTVTEISSALKFGFLERPGPKKVRLTELAKKVLRPQKTGDEVEGLREAILKAPDISDVYGHYRGENLPDEKFFDNALVDTFHIPLALLSEFKSVFLESLQDANLIELHNGKQRIVDITEDTAYRNSPHGQENIKKLGKSVSIGSDDTCFVVMPFAPPLGNHYSLIYEEAIMKAGLKPIRADDDIFATGKIIDQVWRGISTARVLVAELTSRNPNVFYELGMAHALRKPVVLVSSNEADVPFDVRHIRVIYYDVNDPFWGAKLISKVAENILSALNHPEEAIFSGPME